MNLFWDFDDKLMIKADKTINYYKMDKQNYADLVNTSMTKTYRKTTQSEVMAINKEAKQIAECINLGDRVEVLAQKEAFITLKDHKPNFDNKPTCRLINPTKSEIGQVSKSILERIVRNTVKSTGVNLWKSTRDVLNWYRNSHTNQKSSFINFDIIDFYPSITESLLLKANNHAKQYTEILDNEIDIIIHAKRTLVFNGGEPWKKKDNDSGFDVTMGCLDGAETCELVVCYILSILQQTYGKSMGLYRDDGLGISTQSAKQTEKAKQHISKVFNDNGLRITIEVNKKVVNFLDVTLDLITGQYKLYMKPNNKLQYINAESSHLPSILKNIPQSINKRLSEISSCKEAFNAAVPTYQQALDESGFEFKLHYEDPQPETEKRSRKRNIIWFNPPYD